MLVPLLFDKYRNVTRLIEKMMDLSTLGRLDALAIQNVSG
jgi:hypothetical protein